MLFGMCGKKLVSNCPTRWSSTYLLIERLLEVRTSLTAMLEQMEWDNLAASKWKVLEGIHDVLQPFTQYTALIGGEYYTTVLAVIPVIMEINLHLQEVSTKYWLLQVPHASWWHWHRTWGLLVLGNSLVSTSQGCDWNILFACCPTLPTELLK